MNILYERKGFCSQYCILRERTLSVPQGIFTSQDTNLIKTFRQVSKHIFHMFSIALEKDEFIGLYSKQDVACGAKEAVVVCATTSGVYRFLDKDPEEV